MQQLKHREAAIAWFSAVDKLVPLGRRARYLHVHAVLIGPKPGYLRESVPSSSHNLRDCYGLILRVLPSFKPDCSSEKGVEMLGHVPRCEDTRVTGSAEFVDYDAVVDSKAGVGSEGGIGAAPMPTAMISASIVRPSAVWIAQH